MNQCPCCGIEVAEDNNNISGLCDICESDYKKEFQINEYTDLCASLIKSGKKTLEEANNDRREFIYSLIKS
ncbi:hypothetical protein D3C81_846550 [compost metagenome]